MEIPPLTDGIIDSFLEDYFKRYKVRVQPRVPAPAPAKKVSFAEDTVFYPLINTCSICHYKTFRRHSDGETRRRIRSCKSCLRLACDWCLKVDKFSGRPSDEMLCWHCMSEGDMCYWDIKGLVEEQEQSIYDEVIGMMEMFRFHPH